MSWAPRGRLLVAMMRKNKDGTEHDACEGPVGMVPVLMTCRGSFERAVIVGPLVRSLKGRVGRTLKGSCV